MLNDALLSLRLARRDWRAGELRLLLVSLVVAVAAIASVGFFVDRMRVALEQEAAQLLGADLILGADEPLDESFARQAQSLGLRIAHSAIFPSMAVAGGAMPELAAVKAVSADYPLRGHIRLQGPGGGAGEDIEAARAPTGTGLWLDPQLARSLAVTLGDTVQFGERSFRLTGLIAFEPDRGAGFVNFAPRAIFSIDELPATKLIQPASRVHWNLMVAGDATTVAQYRQWVESRLPRNARVESLDSGRPELRATLDRAQRFLSLVALLSALIAAVAIGLAARRFAERHLDGCAVMKAIGITQRRLLALLGLELLWVTLVGALAGIALGWLIQLVLVAALAPLLQITLPSPGWLPVAQALFSALVLMGGFGAWPFLRLAGVSPLHVLRREKTGVPAAAWVTAALALSSFSVLLFWFAGDRRLALIAMGGFALAMVVSAGAAWGFVRLLAAMRHARFVTGSPALRLAFASWSRRRTVTVLQTVALSVGLLALILLTVTRSGLIDGWRQASPPDAPNRFLVNIQPDQVDAVRARLAQAGVHAPQLYPMVRGRLIRVNGADVRPESYDDDRAQRLLDREFNLSWGRDVPEHNRLVQGSGFTPGQSEVSVEQGVLDTLKLALGDELAFDIAGETVTARIVNVRRVDWDSMKVNFFMILSPAALEGRPQTWITAYHQAPGPDPVDGRLVREFPNLTVFDTGNIVRQVQMMLDQVIQAVQFLFVLTLAAGVTVLWGALAGSRDERIREAGLMRALGATARQLASAQHLELALSGALAGVLAALGSIAIGWALADRVFGFRYEPDWWIVPGGAAAGALLALVAGWMSLRVVLRAAPMQTLRSH